MTELLPIEPIDYLIIGHLTQDVTPSGPMLGGTASYASLTARALGLRVGIVTAISADLTLPELAGIPIFGIRGDHTSTFENIYTPEGRIQIVHQVAPSLDLSLVPETWRSAPIVHLGPIAHEVDPNLARSFPKSNVCLTPQGWFRSWDESGRVHFTEWPEADFVLRPAAAAVLSIEDIQHNELVIEEMLASIRVLVVTEGAAGCRVYWNGDLRRFRAPEKEEVDATGAGDIFAAAFFYRFSTTRDPWEAARFATLLASQSVTRRGLASIPTYAEVQAGLVEILPKA